MVRSMTGYGRATHKTRFGQWVIELQTVNRKTFDFVSYFPKELVRFENELRKRVAVDVTRGRITFRITPEFASGCACFASTHLEHLKNLKNALCDVARKLGYNSEEAVPFSYLLSELTRYPQDDVQDQDQDLEGLLEATGRAINSLIGMREDEGDVLVIDIKCSIEKVKKDLAEIRSKAPDVVKKYREKLISRIAEVVENREYLDLRIIQEVAFFAERIDITEEIIRLDSHILQFEEILRSHEKSIGRTLDFLVQEMNRETNTIASKSADTYISQLSVNIRSELEKIKEQIQNIE